MLDWGREVDVSIRAECDTEELKTDSLQQDENLWNKS